MKRAHEHHFLHSSIDCLLLRLTTIQADVKMMHVRPALYRFDKKHPEIAMSQRLDPTVARYAIDKRLQIIRMSFSADTLIEWHLTLVRTRSAEKELSSKECIYLSVYRQQPCETTTPTRVLLIEMQPCTRADHCADRAIQAI